MREDAVINVKVYNQWGEFINEYFITLPSGVEIRKELLFDKQKPSRFLYVLLEYKDNIIVRKIFIKK